MFLLKLIGIFGWIKRAVSAFFAWAMKDVWRLAFVATSLMAGYMAYGRHQEAGRARVALNALAGEQAAHRQTVTNYRAAQVESERQQAAHIAAVKAQRDAVIAKEGTEYENDRIALRARIERLRTKQAATPIRRASGVAMPAAPETPGEPIPPGIDPGYIAVRIEDAETLIDNSLRLRAVLDIVAGSE